MTVSDRPFLSSLYSYPVKGLSPHGLDEAYIRPDETLLYDRFYAIENGPGRFDLSHPQFLPKNNFLMLTRNHRLAMLRSNFEPETHTLTLERGGRQVAKGRLKNPIGRQMIEQFFAAFLKDELRGPPKIVSAENYSFSNVRDKCLHLVNLATVRDFERIVGKPIDPLRFRANLYIDGLSPWQELEWVGGMISIGDTQLTLISRTERCEATNVNPQTGERDVSLLPELTRAKGHAHLGLYAIVKKEGLITPGQKISF